MTVCDCFSNLVCFWVGQQISRELIQGRNNVFIATSLRQLRNTINLHGFFRSCVVFTWVLRCSTSKSVVDSSFPDTLLAWQVPPSDTLRHVRCTVILFLYEPIYFLVFLGRIPKSLRCLRSTPFTSSFGLKFKYFLKLPTFA